MEFLIESNKLFWGNSLRGFGFREEHSKQHDHSQFIRDETNHPVAIVTPSSVITVVCCSVIPNMFVYEPSVYSLFSFMYFLNFQFKLAPLIVWNEIELKSLKPEKISVLRDMFYEFVWWSLVCSGCFCQMKLKKLFDVFVNCFE